MIDSEKQESHNVVQVVMLDVFLPRLEEWLNSQGFTLCQIPVDDSAELPTYCVGVGDELWNSHTTKGADRNE